MPMMVATDVADKTDEHLAAVERRANRMILDPAQSWMAKDLARDALKFVSIVRSLRREPDVLPDEEELS